MRICHSLTCICRRRPCVFRRSQDFLQVSGTKSVDEWQMLKLTGWLCGEFRDELYAEKVLPIIQEEKGGIGIPRLGRT